MQILAKILNTLTSGFNRHFSARLYSGQISNVMQYHSGGDDYNPAADCEAMVTEIADNPAHKFAYCWKDATPRKAQTGEKRLYSVNGGKVCAEIWLKNDGKIEITGDTDISVNCKNANITASESATIDAPAINLGGAGGAPVLTEKSVILDSAQLPCRITSNTAKTKAL